MRVWTPAPPNIIPAHIPYCVYYHMQCQNKFNIDPILSIHTAHCTLYIHILRSHSAHCTLYIRISTQETVKKQEQIGQENELAMYVKLICEHYPDIRYIKKKKSLCMDKREMRKWDNFFPLSYKLLHVMAFDCKIPTWYYLSNSIGGWAESIFSTL